MKYSPLKFAKDFPNEKRKKDTLLCLVLLRPISFLFSSLFVLFGIGANLTSIISLLFSIGSCVFLIIDSFIPNNIFIILSFSFFFVWAILDCVDGNIARSIKKEKYGDFYDAIAGYVYPGLYLLSYGYNAATKYDLLFKDDHSWIILVSSIAGVLMITFLLANKKFIENSNDSLVVKKRSSLMQTALKIGKRFWSEISFGGFMPLFCLLAYIFRVQTTLCLAYSGIFAILSVFGGAYLIIKGLISNRKE